MKHSALLWRKGLALLLCPLCCLGLTACLPTEEIKNTAIVQACGIDFKDGQYTVTLQKFNTMGSGGQTPFDASKPNVKVMQASAPSISQALNLIAYKQGKSLFLGTNNLLIIGRETAEKEGVSSIINFFNSDYETRPNIFVLISQGSAADFMKTQIQQGINPAQGIEKIVERNIYNSTLCAASIMSVVDALQNGAIDPTIPILQVTMDADKKPAIAPLGNAVLRGDKMVAVLPTQATRGLVMVQGKAKRALFTLEDSTIGVVTLLANPIKTHISTDISGGIPHITIEVNCSAAVKEAVREGGGGIEEKEIDALEQALAGKIRQEINLALQTAFFQQGCDIFNISKYLHQQQPTYWRESKDHWREIMPSCSFTITANVNIDRNGLESRHFFYNY